MKFLFLFYIATLVALCQGFGVSESSNADDNGPCGDYPTKLNFDASKVSLIFVFVLKYI